MIPLPKLTTMLLVIVMAEAPVLTQGQFLNMETDQVALAQSNNLSGISKN